MVGFISISLSLFAATQVVGLPSIPLVTRKEPTSGYASQTVCNGRTFTYENLAGYGFISGNATDKYGDTINFGSSLKISGWTLNKTTGLYSGIFWGLPDRGWNTEGTINYQPRKYRVHQYKISFTPESSSATPNLLLEYLNTILLTDPLGTPLTGLDATGIVKIDGFPDLPAANYTGDGFGGAGPGGTRVSLDAEGLVLAQDGGFWISDEYYPAIYCMGKMRKAIRPPNAIIPIRNGTESFSADSPPLYDASATVTPANPATGRANNQGFEGLTASYDGRSLYALLQSALDQEGGLDKTTNRNARLVKYDISTESPRYAAEYVVQLPTYVDPTKSAKNNPRTAAQSEILSVGDNQFFVLARDSNFGFHGSSGTMSNYRHADIFDITNATDIKGKYDSFNSSITTTPTSKDLVSSITPALYCSFLDYNNNTELNKFGLHNGGAADSGLLNEKWESLGLVPVDGADGDNDEYFLFTASDNDFVTQDGHIDFGKIPYSDESGLNSNNQVMVFKIKLPDHSRPFARSGSGKGGLTVT